MGDVPVLDEGRFISKKIHAYWLTWNAGKVTGWAIPFGSFVEAVLQFPPKEYRDAITRSLADRCEFIWDHVAELE